MVMTEVIPSEIHGEGRSQVFPLSRPSVCEARESANLHSYSQVATLDVRRANSCQVGIPPHQFNRGIYYPWWRVPVFLVRRCLVHFNQLGVMNASPQASVNSVEVGYESIGRDLKSPGSSFVQLLSEGHRIPSRSLPEVPGQDQLCCPLDSDEAISVTASGVVDRVALLFATAKSPQLIALNIRHRQVADSAFQKSFALFADEDEQGKNCGVVKSGEPLDRAYGTTFAQKLNGLGSLIQRGIHAAKRCGTIFGEGFRAPTATIALKTVAMLSKFLAAGIAVVTRHFGLPFSRSKPIMGSGSALRLTPRADLASLVALNYRQGVLLTGGPGEAPTHDRRFSKPLLCATEVPARKLLLLSAICSDNSSKRILKDVLISLLATNGRGPLFVQVLRVCTDLFSVFPETPKNSTQSTSIIQSEQSHKLFVGLPITVFKESINQLSLVPINQLEEISDSLLSPAGTGTVSGRLCFRRMRRGTTFDPLRQFKGGLSGIAIYRSVANPDSVCHVSYLHPDLIVASIKSIVKEKTHNGIYF